MSWRAAHLLQPLNIVDDALPKRSVIRSLRARTLIGRTGPVPLANDITFNIRATSKKAAVKTTAP